MFRKQLIPEQAVHGKHGGTGGEIAADLADGFLGDGFKIAELQKEQDIGIIDLAKTGQGVSVYFFDGNNAGIIPVDLPERIFKGLRQNLLIRDMQDALVNLLGRLAVQRAEYVIGAVCVGGDKTVIPQWMINVFFVCFDPPAEISHDRIGNGIVIDNAIGGYQARVAGSPDQRDLPGPQDRINGAQHAGVVPAAEINTHRIALCAAGLCKVALQAFDIFNRYGRNLLKDIGRRGDSILKRDDADSIFHNPVVITHTDTADAGNTGIERLQIFDMGFKLGMIG